jgi:hypothetical protein
LPARREIDLVQARSASARRSRAPADLRYQLPRSMFQ